MAPPRQTVVADIDGMGQPEVRDPGKAGFFPGPESAGLAAAPDLTWFGAGLGGAGFWMWPTARPWSWPDAGRQLASPGAAAYPFHARVGRGPEWVLSLTRSEEAAERMLPWPAGVGSCCLGIGELVIVSERGEISRGGGGAPIVTCAKC
jgi:hypothetical protein